jgi:hypothetical protein
MVNDFSNSTKKIHFTLVVLSSETGGEAFSGVFYLSLSQQRE